MACGSRSAIQDAPETGEPYVVRTCDDCGRKIRVRERGKHGIGIEVKKGDQFVLPEGFIQISANPLKGGGHLSKPGLTWFAEIVFSSDLHKWSGEPSLPLAKTLEGYTDELRNSELLKGIDLDDEVNRRSFSTRCQRTNTDPSGSFTWPHFMVRWRKRPLQKTMRLKQFGQLHAASDLGPFGFSRKILKRLFGWAIQPNDLWTSS
jgi:hypothetical protein